MLPALIVSFPSLTGNFCFMFTSSAYAWSFFLAVLAVYLFRDGEVRRGLISVPLLVLALGIYQAYISVAAYAGNVTALTSTIEAISVISRSG